MVRDCLGTGSAGCHNEYVSSTCDCCACMKKKKKRVYFGLKCQKPKKKKFDNTGSDSDLFSVFFSVGSTFSSIKPQSLVYMLRGWVSATLGDDFRFRHEHAPTE